MMNSLQKISTLVAVLLLVQISACSSDNKAKTSSLSWAACKNEMSLECSSLKVPMDYSKPAGEQIDIALIRRKATGADRKGSLVINPGGPGASGVAVLAKFADGQPSQDEMPASILAAYDIVSFDPRGVGESKPVDCAGLDDINTYPVNEAAIREVHAQYSAFAANCSAKYGDYLLHLGSLNVVKDMEKIRIALGEPKLNFIGYSYGTRLAALYLQEFPSKSGRIVLDASGDPDPSLRTFFSGLLPQQQANIVSVLSRCTITDPSCDPTALLSTLLDRINLFATPRSQAQAQEFGILYGVSYAASLDPEFGERASVPLVEYLNTLDVSILERFLRRNDQMGGDDGLEDNQTLATAVFCADSADRLDVESLASALYDFNQIADLFAESQVSQLAKCSGWPAAVEPLAPIVTFEAPLSLVIGGTFDAQAPLDASEDMAAKLGGVFIKSNHVGHTAVFNGVSECVDDLVETFLLDGKRPLVRECDED